MAHALVGAIAVLGLLLWRVAGPAQAFLDSLTSEHVQR